MGTHFLYLFSEYHIISKIIMASFNPEELMIAQQQFVMQQISLQQCQAQYFNQQQFYYEQHIQLQYQQQDALHQFPVQQLAQQHLPTQIHNTQPSLLPGAQEQYLSQLQQQPSRYEQQFPSTGTIHQNQLNPRGTGSFFSEIRKQGNVL